LAASLLLLPGISAVGAEMLHLLGNARAQDRAATVTSEQTEAVVRLMEQARAAYDKGDFAKAQELCESVKAMKVAVPVYVDSPDKLLADMKRKSGPATGPAAAKQSGNAPRLASTEDPHVLVKKARDAYESGRLDAAQDLAKQAEANSRGTSWGLFEDTPDDILKKIQKARSKRDRAEADRLLTQARSLYEKRVQNDEVRAANLDKARSYCLQAAQLHGPYGMWDFGDRPQSLLKDIDAARSRLNVAVRRPDSRNDMPGPNGAKDGGPYNTVGNPKLNPMDPKQGPVDPKAVAADQEPSVGGYNASRPMNKGQNSGGVATRPDTESNDQGPKLGGYNPIGKGMGGGVIANKKPAPLGVFPVEDQPSKVQQAEANDPPKTGSPLTLRKAQALQRMKLAQACQARGDFVQARVHLAEAQKQNAAFDLDEETPELALQSLMSAAQKRIDVLCHDAHEKMVKQSVEGITDAERKLGEADAIAVGLGLDRWGIDSHRDTLRLIKSKASAVVSKDPPPVIKDPPIGPVGDPTPAVEPKITVFEPKTPVVEPKTPVVEPKTSVDPEPVVKMPDQGLELLKQAHNELTAKAYDNARKIATQVLNGPYQHQSEAQDLLRTIDAIELTQRKQAAVKSYEHGLTAYQQRNFAQALSIFKLVDPMLLPETKRAELGRKMAAAEAACEKPSGVAVVTGPKEVPDMPVEKGGADNILKQEEAMRELQFQKLRSKGLQVESTATARFGKGETDAALTELNGFIAEVKTSSIEPAKQALLIRPIESRIERLKILKHQQDFLTKEAKDLRNFRNNMTQDALQQSHKKEEVARMMKDYHRLIDERKFDEAYKTALVMRELDSDDPATLSALKMSQILIRKKNWDDQETQVEDMVYKGIHDARNPGPAVDSKDPLKFDPETFNRLKNRSTASGGISTLRPRTDKERQIESMLNSKTISLNFKETPLDEVVAYMATYSGVNFDLDTRALANDPNGPISSKTPITASLHDLSLKSALSVVLDKANLRYILKHDVVRITTQRGARGELVQRTIPVADLVVPVQNFAPSPISDLETRLQQNLETNGLTMPGAGTPYTPSLGLPASSGTATGAPSRSGGTLSNNPTGATVTKNQAAGTIEESLIRLITNSVKPDTWESMGGPGRIEYYPLGMALVINQTPDVIEEVLRLLEALRQLQDLEIAIEVRMITLAETFYERIGLDFGMNLSTHNDRATLNLVQTNGGLLTPNAPNAGPALDNFRNIMNAGAKKIIGLQAPDVPTRDLDVPIRATSFGPSIPPFGNFPNAPGADGGISLGLAFLSDIQVQMFLEAAQGDRRTNVMQAPKLTMFNGQSANISINDQQFFLTGINVTTVSGQLVFSPQNSPFPLGVAMFMQPVVTGDRRFVRLNIQQTMTNLASATVPLFPITTIVTPIFEGGIQGQPIPFTQYIQQPTFSTITVRTTVMVPDGGTVLLGGLKTLSEGRNEFGPPVLSKIPYINRLFRNVGYGREAQSLMMMVTPRIIINREEQERQTGVREGIEE
jgi:type II secretory pathway component GspD/PulD (secretin)